MGPVALSSSSREATTTLRETGAPEETEAAGEEMGASLQRGDLLLLKGELGAGKTTFVRGLARGCGSQALVASPTFQLVRVYPGRVQLAHVDLYRMEEKSELADLGLEDLLEEGAVVIEWGDRLGPQDAALLSIEHLGSDRRRLTLERALRR
jgi:tRNA threonylcarbamoyladenosine biosynthesis protein TsaE